MANIGVNLAERSYDISITTDDWGGLGPFARQRCRGLLACVVTDEHAALHTPGAVESLRSTGFQVMTEILPAGETQKSLTRASELYNKLAELPADRQTLIVAFGGGVIGDLAGFVAATYARGIP